MTVRITGRVRPFFLPMFCLLVFAGCATTVKRGSHGLYRLNPHNSETGPALRLFRNRIIDGSHRRVIGFAQLVEALKERQVVYVGERHDHPGHHRLQHQLIEALSREGRPAIALEMFPARVQSVLTRYVRGELGEREFARQAGWFRHWGFDYRLYRPIFRLARERKLPLIAVNLPRRVVRQVGRHGLASLSSKDRGSLPSIYLGNSAHRRLFTSMIGGHHFHGKLKRRLKFLYQAQSVWDEVMADGIRRQLIREPRRRVIVIVGSGHLLYNLGISMRLARRMSGIRQATVIPVRVEGSMRLVSAQVGDFLVGSPPAKSRYPSIGVSVRSGPDGLRVHWLARGKSPGRRAGLRVGDRIVTVDGTETPTAFDFYWAQFGQTPDRLSLVVLRGKRRLRIELVIR